MKTIVSLFDHGGTWSSPYLAAGWNVVRVDMLIDPESVGNSVCIQGDVQQVTDRAIHGAINLANQGKYGIISVEDAVYAYDGHRAVDVVISATPCTAFTRAGVAHWKKWDANGTTQMHLDVFDHQFKLIQSLGAPCWALENPPGRLANKKGSGIRQDILGRPAYQFDPWEFVPGSADPEHPENYTKLTYLWGSFCAPEKHELREKPDMSRYGKLGRIQWLGGANKRLRSKTPVMFAEAFFRANS